MTSASFEKMPPAVLSREYVTYLEKKKLSELVWSRELFLFHHLVKLSGRGVIIEIEFCRGEGLEQSQDGVLRFGAHFPLAFEFLLFLLQGCQFGVFHQRFEFVRLRVFSVLVPENAGQPAAFFFRTEQGIFHVPGNVFLSSRFPASCSPSAVGR